MLYLFIILLCIALIYIYDYARATKYKSLCYTLLCLTFILISGLRYRIGIDSIRYEAIYEGLPNLSNLDFSYISFDYAPGYVLFVALLKSISPDFLFFQIVHAFLINVIIFRFFKGNTRNIFFAITCYFLFYFYFFNCEVLRESLAVAIFLLGWKDLVAGKWTKYYIWSAIAVSLHYSAVITLVIPLFFLKPFSMLLDMSWKTIAIIIVAYLSTAYIGSHFFDILSQFNSVAILADYSTRYSNSETYGSSIQLNLMGSLYFFIKYISYPILATYLLKISKDQFNPRVVQAFQIIVFLFVTVSIFSLAIKILIRFISYFYPIVSVIMASFAFEKIRIRPHRLLKLSFGIWFFVFLPYFAFNMMQYWENINMGNNYREYYKFYPYTSVISQDKIPQREEIINYYVH